MKGKKTSSEKVNKKPGTKPIVVISMAAALCVCCIVYVLYALQSYRLEQGLVDVCAAQQDAYVQLVLDQIYLKDNRDNQEIVEEILGTLDASSNKYWTFSDDQTMLFVKDVLETNKYKGFTAETYFVSDSAKEFFEELRTNKVTHSIITIGEGSYIASGVVFEYMGDSYKLCLLTNKMVLLENNQLLRATTEIAVLIFGLTVLFVLTALCYAMKVRKLGLELTDNLDTMKTMNRHIENLNEQLSKWDIHDTRSNAWKRDALLKFAEKLQARNAYPIGMVKVETKDAEAVKRLLERAHYLLDHNVLRFILGDTRVLFLFVQNDKSDIGYEMKAVVDDTCNITDIAVVEEASEVDLVTYCKNILGAEEDAG